MTITVTPDASSAPPRNTIAVSVTAGSVMSSVAIYRKGADGHRVLLRTQPAAGFDSRSVVDYECHYGESVVYDWTATYTDPTSYSTVFNETWASTAAWTPLGSGTGWTVASSKAKAGASPTQNLTRGVTLGKYRVTIASIESAVGAGQVFFWDDTTGDTLYLRVSNGVLLIDGVVTTIDASHPITVDFLTSSISIVGTGGSVSQARSMNFDKVYLQNDTAGSNVFMVGAIKVESRGSVLSIAQAAGAVVLEPDDAWLINVATPGNSFRLSNTDPEAAGVRTFGDVVNTTNATLHPILGASTPIPTTSGPRSADVTSITIWTGSSAERVALRTLLRDDIPILINVPLDWDTDFQTGYYAFGDSSEKRESEWLSIPLPYRVFDYPLTKVQSPVVDVANAGWSYSQLAVDVASYTTVVSTFATYADLASNTRS